MHRQPLLQLLNTYEPYDSDEVSLKEKIINFITHHPDCFERTCREGHITASAWIVNFTGDQFLMTLHKKRKLWLPLGGHSDGDCDIHHTSLREAQEESGLKSLAFVSKNIFDDCENDCFLLKKLLRFKRLKTRLSGGMADASDLGSDAVRRKGSSPFSSTRGCYCNDFL